MGRSWEEQYVDRGIERAWLDLRLTLADRFAEGVETGEMEQVDVTTPDGCTLTAIVDDDHVVVVAGSDIVTTDNVDEAAYEVVRKLREEWEVIHPCFLDSDLIDVVDVPQDADDAFEVCVPTFGQARSREQLHEWVVATFNEGREAPIVVSGTDDIAWRSDQGSKVYVSVRTSAWIEVWTVLGRRLNRFKAHRVMDRLAPKHPDVRFAILDDRLIASRIIDGGPFVPQHLTDALDLQMALADKLQWVAAEVRRERPARPVTPVADPALVALLASANRVPKEPLQAAVAEAAGTADVLLGWRRVAFEQWTAARKLPREDGDPHDVNRLLRLGWYRLMRAASAAAKTLEEKGDAA